MKPILIAMLLVSALAYFTEETPGQAGQTSSRVTSVARARTAGDEAASSRTNKQPAAVAGVVVESPHRSVATPAH